MDTPYDILDGLEKFYQSHLVYYDIGEEGQGHCIWGALIQLGVAKNHGMWGTTTDPNADVAVKALKMAMPDTINEIQETPYLAVSQVGRTRSIGGFNDQIIAQYGGQINWQERARERMLVWLRRAKLHV